MSATKLWYPHHIERYRRKTGHLTLMEHGAYRLLMDAYWDRRGPLPADETRLRKLIGADAEEWAQVRDAVMAFFTLTPDGWVHEKIEENIAAAEEKYQGKVERVAAARAKIRRGRSDINTDYSDDQKPEITTTNTNTNTNTSSYGSLARERAKVFSGGRKKAAPAPIPAHSDPDCAPGWTAMTDRFGPDAMRAWFMAGEKPALRKNCAGFVIESAHAVTRSRIDQQYGAILNEIFGKRGWRVEPPP